MKKYSWKRAAIRILAAFVVCAVSASIHAECILSVSPVVVRAVDERSETIRNVSSFDELTAALADASVSEIHLLSDITLTQMVTITRNITIDGNDHVMTGSGVHRGFAIDAGVHAVIKNATITGIDAGHQHSGVFYNLGTLSVENCILKNNRSTYSAVILEAASNSVQIFRNCQILHNEANGQGSVFQNYRSPSKTTFEGCIIAGNKNHAENGSGGAICFREGSGEITLNGCILSNNTNSDLSAYNSETEFDSHIQIKNSVFGTVYDDQQAIIENAVQNGSKMITGLSILNDDGTLKDIDDSSEAITTANSFVWSKDYDACTLKIMKIYETGIMTKDHACTIRSVSYEATAETCGVMAYTAEATADGTTYTDTKEVITQHARLIHYDKGEIVALPISGGNIRCGKIVACYYCPNCDTYFSDEQGKQEILRENLFRSDPSQMSHPNGAVSYDFAYSPESKTGSLQFYSCFDADTYEIPSRIQGYTVTSVGSQYMYDVNTKLTSLVVPESVTSLYWYGRNSLKSVTIRNKNTEIYGLGYGTENLTVYGYIGSTAESYVNKYNSDENHTNTLQFVALDTMEAPTITTHPQDAVVRIGDRGVFAVAAAGTQPLSYQWMIDRKDGKGWVALHGATNASYTTEAVTMDHHGVQYKCVVKNKRGSVESNTVTLTVKEESPVSYTIIEGADQIIEKGSDRTIRFTINGEVSKFVSVSVDGAVIDASNYTIKSGSTIITFHKAYVNSLSIGKHTIRFTYTDAQVDTTFTIKAASDDKTDDSTMTDHTSGDKTTADTSEDKTIVKDDKAGNGTTNDTIKEKDKNPMTGDHTSVAGLLFTAILSGAGLVVAAKKKPMKK